MADSDFSPAELYSSETSGDESTETEEEYMPSAPRRRRLNPPLLVAVPAAQAPAALAVSIDWNEAIKQPQRIGTRAIIASQLETQNLCIPKFMERRMSNGYRNSDGGPRAFSVEFKDGYQDFLASPRLPGILHGLAGLRLGPDPVTPGQLKVIAYLAYDLGTPRPQGTVTFDASSLLDRPRPSTNPNDQDYIQVQCGVPRDGSGVVLLDTVTGSGKTFMVLAAAILTGANEFEAAVDRFERQLELTSMRARGGARFLDEQPDRLKKLARAVTIRAATPTMLAHFEEQLALVLPSLLTIIGDVVLEVWVNSPTAALARAVAESGGRVVLGRSGKMTLGQLTDLPADRLVLWFMTLQSSDNNKLRRLQPSKKLGLDVASSTGPQDIYTLLDCCDEMMDPAGERWPNQGVHSLSHWVLQATPSQLLSVKLSDEHWLRMIVPKSLAALCKDKHLSPRQAEEAIRGLLRLNLVSLPQALRHEVAMDVVARMPVLGIEVMPVRCQMPFLARPSEGQDGLTRLALDTFVLTKVGRASWTMPNEVGELRRVCSTPVVSLTALCLILKQIVAKCRCNSLLINREAQDLQLLVDRIERPDDCAICCDATQLGGNMVIMPCCTGVVCRGCVDRLTNCCFCRSQLDQVVVGPSTGAVVSAEPTLAELSARTTGLTTPIRTLQNCIAALKAEGLASRILLLCCESYVISAVDLGVRMAALSGKVGDRAILADYTRGDNQPMALYCRNSMATVAGHNLGCTTAIVVMGGLSNPDQLVARVIRAGDTTNSGHYVPLINIQ
jgi:hypothetical protein